jgi:hypothetical protein
MDYPRRSVKDSTDAVSGKLGVDGKPMTMGNVVDSSSYPIERSTGAARLNTRGECVVGGSHQVFALLILR